MSARGNHPRAVIFDLDGTLVDSLADISTAMNGALAELGLPVHPAAAYRHFIGDGVEPMALRALPPERRDTASLSACVALWRRRYGDCLLEQTRPYPGVSALIDALSARGLRLAVLSNKADDLTLRIVAALFPGAPFAEVRGAREGVPKKPDPTAALAIAETLGVPPTRCLYVGDTAIDLDTARAARMVPVGVLWGFRPEQLRESNTAQLLEQPAALLNWLPGQAELPEDPR
ncbi:MAG: HAD family hydrolase [Proteobacteria bacterium]|nr:HAD family hydrolase [Pseudomonadota bacterium]